MNPDDETTEEARQRFKTVQLRCIAMNRPWETSLTWSDAATDLGLVEPGRIDEVVRAIQLDLFDDGFVDFFVISDFSHENYMREPSPSEALDRDALAAALIQLPSPADFILGMRATSAAYEENFKSFPEDRTAWLKRDA